MPNRLSYRRRPERCHRNSTAISALHGFAHQIRLRRSARQPLYIILPPVITRPLKGPHVVRLRLRIRKSRIEAMLLHYHLINLEVARSHVLVGNAHQRNIREVVIDFDRQHPLNVYPRRRQRTRRNFYSLPAS